MNNIDSISGKVPRHNLDAEAAVLSAMMLDRDALLTAADVLDPTDFYATPNRDIFAAATTMAKAGLTVDVVTVNAFLKSRANGNSSVDAAYLCQIVDATPSVENVAAHARIVKNLSGLREFQAKAGVAAAEAYGDIGDDIEGWMQTKVSDLGTVSVGRSAERGADLEDALIAAYSKWNKASQGFGISIKTGLNALDNTMGAMKDGQLIVLGAHSGIGKTSLARNIAVNVALGIRKLCQVCASCVDKTKGVCADHPDDGFFHSRNAVLFFAAEMKIEELSEQISFTAARVDSTKMDEDRREFVTQEEWARLASAGRALAKARLRIIDDVYDMETIRTEAIKHKRAVQDTGDTLTLIVIDYAQIISPSKGFKSGRENREQVVAAVGRAAKMLAKELGCPVILCAQLNEDSRKEGRKPNASDLRESRGLMNDADKVILIYNPALEERAHGYTDDRDNSGADETIDCAELILAKCRSGGKTGIARVAFYPPYTQFANWPEGVEMPEPREPKKPGKN